MILHKTGTSASCLHPIQYQAAGPVIGYATIHRKRFRKVVVEDQRLCPTRFLARDSSTLKITQPG